MPDFPVSNIPVRYNSNSWGPFNFDLTDSIPLSTTISGVIVRSFLGHVDQGDDLDDESTTELIDTSNVAVRDDVTVDVYFNAPTSASFVSRSGVTHTIVFEVTLNTGAVHSFYFHRVVAYDG